MNDIRFTSEYGWKHWLVKKPIDHRDDTYFVVLVRNPFDWIESLFRRPYHVDHELRGLQFSDFVTREWKCVWDQDAHVLESDIRYGQEMMFERNPDSGERFGNVFEMRSVKNQHWRSIEKLTANFLLLTFEEVRGNPVTTLETIAKFTSTDMPSRVDTPKGYKGSLSLKRKLALCLSLGTVGHYKPRPKRPFSEDELELVMKSLDLGLEADMGFDLHAIVENLREGRLEA